jgi:hypothetical protein
MRIRRPVVNLVRPGVELAGVHAKILRAQSWGRFIDGSFPEKLLVFRSMRFKTINRRKRAKTPKSTI